THGLLTEFAATWVLSLMQSNQQSGLLPPPEVRTDKLHRYNGYTTFGMAKIALPVRSVLDYYAVEAAKSVLRALVMPHRESAEGWINRIVNRAHNELLTQGLVEQHVMIDKLRELSRRLNVDGMKNRVDGGSRSQKGWQTLMRQEWEYLVAENETYATAGDGTPRDVIRKRLDEALSTGFRKLVNSLEEAAVGLAFTDGYGLEWTTRAYRQLREQFEEIHQKMAERVLPAKREMDRLRRDWFEAAEARTFDVLDEMGKELILLVAHWIAWQVRTEAWQELLKIVDGLIRRLELAIQQIPHDIEKLDTLGQELREELEKACVHGPEFPAGALCTDDWIREGVRNIPK
ncbi:MAG TPA: hypothetical protein VJZ27_01975, partial [Aggregatilineales bacterium]|nr:hypothetical protein [Aggregatilineales bacterium]